MKKLILLFIVVFFLGACVQKEIQMNQEEILDNFSEFNGHYVSEYDNAYIDFDFLDDNKVKIQGDAWWQGVNPENIHIGNFAAIVNHNETHVIYKAGDNEYDCVVEIFFEDKNHLTATDNNNCGGMNVSFTAKYTKESNEVPNWELYNDFQ